MSEWPSKHLLRPCEASSGSLLSDVCAWRKVLACGSFHSKEKSPQRLHLPNQLNQTHTTAARHWRHSIGGRAFTSSGNTLHSLTPKMMLCSRPAVSLTRTSIRNFKPPTLSRAFVNAPQRRLQKPQLSKWQHQRPHSLAISAYRPFSTSLLRLQDVSKPISERKFEEQHEHEKLEADPEIVSSTSSIHPVFGEVGEPKEEKEEDMMGEIKSDLVSLPPPL